MNAPKEARPGQPSCNRCGGMHFGSYKCPYLDQSQCHNCGGVIAAEEGSDYQLHPNRKFDSLGFAYHPSCESARETLVLILGTCEAFGVNKQVPEETFFSPEHQAWLTERKKQPACDPQPIAAPSPAESAEPREQTVFQCWKEWRDGPGEKLSEVGPIAREFAKFYADRFAASETARLRAERDQIHKTMKKIKATALSAKRQFQDYVERNVDDIIELRKQIAKAEAERDHWHNQHDVAYRELNQELCEVRAERDGLRDAVQGKWMRLPDEQTWYWHWDGEDLSVPFLYSVMASHTGPTRYFIAAPNSRWCDQVGGWWLKITRPNILSRAEQAERALAALPGKETK